MNGYCEKCGSQIASGGKCDCSLGGGTSVESPLAMGPSAVSLYRAQEIGPLLPKPSTPRRLLGSGIEYIAYSTGIWVVAALDVSSGGILGLSALIVAALIILRDFNAGRFSISKRVSNMRVVDWRTGQTASNGQALLRNSYYFGLPLLAAFLPFFDLLSSPLFMMFVTLDIMMILANHQGRRLGDFLAGTQVVEARV
jgi:uncharacterized RDD family membrane protein YckC